MAGRLRVTPIRSIPERIAVGDGTAIFLDGVCSHPDGPLEDLRVSVDGVEHSVLATGMPPPGDRTGSDYWWAIIPLEAVSRPRPVQLSLRARTARGEEAVGDLGSSELHPSIDLGGTVPRPRARATGDTGGARGGRQRPLVAICMATYDPPVDLFRRQIESIRAQTYENWVCVISDDGSSPARVAEMRGVLADDERFWLTPGADRLGVYGNFERALALAPPEAELLAMCDQDDRWYPEKLEVLESSMEPGTKLVYSDMRVVDRTGRVHSDTYWTHRRNNHTNFASLVLANTVTGAASLFTREVVDYALPFPLHYGDGFHDHWVALVAMALGEIGYVDRPLYDYVQHGGAFLGHARANGLLRGVPRGAEPAGGGTTSPGRLARLLSEGVARETRRLYFTHCCGTALAAMVAEMRCGSTTTPAKRRTLRRLTHAERMVGWLGLRSLRSCAGRTETLRREQAMLGGLAWRHGAELRKRVRRRLSILV